MKVCFKCGETKRLHEFYKHAAMADGHVNKCKECNKKDVRKHYQDTKPARQAYDHSRLHKPHRIEARRAYAEANPDAFIKGHKAYAERWPEKRFAHYAVSNAVRDKRLFKQPCHCGEIKVEAHHSDYSKPLDVMWLCKRHHLAEHGKVLISDLNLMF